MRKTEKSLSSVDEIRRTGEEGALSVERGNGRRHFSVEVGDRADAQQVDVKQIHALGLAHGLADKGGLAHAPFPLYDDVLPRFDEPAQFLFQHGARAEEVSVDDAAVFEWIHGAFLLLLHHIV